MAERKLETGRGFVRAKECPDCGHTRCGEDCVCNCDAARAEHELAQLRAEVMALKQERDAGQWRNWYDCAVQERVLRVKAEARVKELEARWDKHCAMHREGAYGG